MAAYRKQKMKIAFAGDDWSYSFDELKEKEGGLRERLLEAYRQINMLRQGGELDKPAEAAALEHARKAINDYKKALEEVEELIRQRKAGTA
ncbi:MAG: hypothetical protein PHU56_03930 [Candidatus Pacebacteria bacterium]|nr:hypothetical protein [Candidatus Paceibacterota bacterium]